VKKNFTSRLKKNFLQYKKLGNMIYKKECGVDMEEICPWTCLFYRISEPILLNG